MCQLADTFIELSKYEFPLLGSLTYPLDNSLDNSLIIPSTALVGAYARESLANFAQSKLCTTGPFSSLKEYYTSWIQFILDLIIQEEMYSHPQAVDAYLLHRFLLDLVPLVLPPTQDNDGFYLKHADDKGDHILVDEQFNITGIIDWEWAYTAPASLAFNSPMGLLPVGDFYKGSNSLGDDEITFAKLLEEKGHADLAQSVWNGRVQHQFAFCCGYNLSDWDGFTGLFRGLREAVGVDVGLEWNEWKIMALNRYQEDAGLKAVISKRGHQSRVDCLASTKAL